MNTPIVYLGKVPVRPAIARRFIVSNNDIQSKHMKSTSEGNHHATCDRRSDERPI